MKSDRSERDWTVKRDKGMRKETTKQNKEQIDKTNTNGLTFA